MKTCKHCPWFFVYPAATGGSGRCYAEPHITYRQEPDTVCHYYLDYFERLGLKDKPEAPDAP